MKNTLMIFLLILISGSFLNLAVIFAGLPSDPEDLGWKQYAGRVPHLYVDPVTVDSSVKYIVGTDIPLISINNHLGFSIIDCCRPNQDPHSWCNYSADDERCRN